VFIPVVHDLIRVLWIIGSDFAVDELLRRNVVVGGLVVAQLGFDQQPVARSIPGHVTLLVLA